MNNFFQELSECINPYILQDFDVTSYDARVTIKEDDANSKSEDFFIDGLDKDNTIILKADNMQCIYHPRTQCNIVSLLLSPDKEHLFESCDYIILSIYNNKTYCIFLENKDDPSGKGSKIKRKLEKSKYLWDYFLQLLKYYEIEFDINEINYLYVLSSLKYNNGKQFKHTANEKVKVFGSIEVKPIPQLKTHISRLVKS